MENNNFSSFCKWVKTTPLWEDLRVPQSHEKVMGRHLWWANRYIGINFDKPLVNAFMWSESPQGHTFWAQIDKFHKYTRVPTHQKSKKQFYKDLTNSSLLLSVQGKMNNPRKELWKVSLVTTVDLGLPVRQAFYWVGTPQGPDFWYHVYTSKVSDGGLI